MRLVREHFRRLREDRRGSMVVETAVLAPVLAILALGIYETSMIVSRQHELQSAATEVEMIAIATNQGAETTTGELQNILRDSLGLTDNDVKVSRRFRCGTEDRLRPSSGPCGKGTESKSDDDYVSTYLQIEVTDTYTPTWTGFGIGQPITFNVDRTVQIS